MDTVKCWCGREAEYGCHGITHGELHSFSACSLHKAWGSAEANADQMTENSSYDPNLDQVPTA